jgi:hypothetical protein
MNGRSVMVVATVLAATAIIGGWWIAADERAVDERATAKRPATTMTAHEAARLERAFLQRLAREVEAGRVRLPVLDCDRASPDQQFWCASARRLTPAVLAGEISSPTSGGTTWCPVQSEEGEFLLFDPDGGRCLLW